MPIGEPLPMPRSTPPEVDVNPDDAVRVLVSTDYALSWQHVSAAVEG